MQLNKDTEIVCACVTGHLFKCFVHSHGVPPCFYIGSYSDKTWLNGPGFSSKIQKHTTDELYTLDKNMCRPTDRSCVMNKYYVLVKNLSKSVKHGDEILINI